MVIIIGAGKFGQAISKLLGSNKNQFVALESDGTYSSDSVEKIKSSDRLVFCVPSSALAECVDMISGIVNPDAKLLSCVKGLYDGLKTPSQLIKSRLKNPVAALMGPNLSVEIMLERPAFAVVAGDFDDEWVELFDSANFKAVSGTDMVGIEFGGAIKNIVALGAGLFDGFYDGDACNAMGSFSTFALREIELLYRHKNASDIPRLSLIGDLFATCMSETSRNHDFGHKYGIALRLGKVLPVPEDTVEGYHTIRIVQKYADQHKFRIPTITALYNVFFGKGRIDDIVGSWV
jgi:glycerol-3-phosphate dehydrogenase (NAD(P)+)